MYTGGDFAVLKVLFSSATRVKLLSLFVANPQNRYYLREIIKLINAPLRAAQRELSKLESINLLSKKVEGNRVYYQVNTGHFIFPEIKNLILKTVGFGDAIRSPLLREKEIKVAFIYGSYAENEETAKSDIDLFIIGTVSGRKLQSIIRRSSQTYGREINLAVYSPDEFEKKRKGHFISSVLKRPKILLKGNIDAF